MSLFDRATACMEDRMIYRGGCHRFLSVSELARKVFLEEYPVDPERVMVLPLGSTEPFTANSIGSDCRRDVRARLGIGPDNPLILFVSMNFAVKGLDHLLQGLGRLRARDPDARFRLLVSVGSMRRPTDGWPGIWGSGMRLFSAGLWRGKDCRRSIWPQTATPCSLVSIPSAWLSWRRWLRASPFWSAVALGPGTSCRRGRTASSLRTPGMPMLLPRGSGPAQRRSPGEDGSQGLQTARENPGIPLYCGSWEVYEGSFTVDFPCPIASLIDGPDSIRSCDADDVILQDESGVRVVPVDEVLFHRPGETVPPDEKLASSIRMTWSLMGWSKIHFNSLKIGESTGPLPVPSPE